MYKIIDSIVDETPQFETFQECVAYIKENYISVEEGIHPDIESLEIYELSGTVKVTALREEGDKTICQVDILQCVQQI